MAKAKTRRTARKAAGVRKRAKKPAKSKASGKASKPARKAPARASATSRSARSRPRASRPTRKTARKRTPARVAARAARPPARKAAAPRRKAAPAKPIKVRTVKAVKASVRVKVAAVAKPLKRVKAARPAKVTRPVAAPAKRPLLDRERRRLPESDLVPTPPSSLDLDRSASAARTGQAEIQEALAEHTETGPEITAGDLDASWESAYSTGDEAPGGDNPTPDQDVVDDIGKSLGVVYEDSEELKGAEKITERDKHRWELDPASAEDYNER